MRQLPITLVFMAALGLTGIPGFFTGSLHAQQVPDENQDEATPKIELLSRDQLERRVEQLERLAKELERQLKEAKEQLERPEQSFWVEVPRDWIPARPPFRVQIPGFTPIEESELPQSTKDRLKRVIRVQRVPANVNIQMLDLQGNPNLRFPEAIERAMMLDSIRSISEPVLRRR